MAPKQRQRTICDQINLDANRSRSNADNHKHAVVVTIQFGRTIRPNKKDCAVDKLESVEIAGWYCEELPCTKEANSQNYDRKVNDCAQDCVQVTQHGSSGVRKGSLLNSLPFENLNLRRNPFGEFTAEERVQLAFVDLDSPLAHLNRDQPGNRNSNPAVQVVGEQGYGKSTHLLSLAARFANSAYVYIAEGERATIPSQGDPLLIDEAQRLTLWQRFVLFRSSRRLVLGTHRDFTRQLQRAGREVLTMPADRHTTPERIAEILNARIRAVRRNDGEIPQVSNETVLRLFQQFGSDVRSIQHSLYDVFQELRSITDV